MFKPLFLIVLRTAARRLPGSSVSLACVWLGGCALLAPPRPAPVQLPREAIQSFYLEARLALTHDQTRTNVSIEWQHAPTSDEILVRSPIGQTLARLTASPQGALLETIDHQRFEAPTLDALTEQALGWRLPVAGMSDWVLGRSSQPTAAGQRDRHGRWREFTESGWRVAYAEYESDAPHALPILIDLNRGALQVRLRNDQWTLTP
jgi:outer membrane lipoprotein LolB